MAPDRPRRNAAPLWVRALRVAALTAVLAAAGWRLLPRLLVSSVGDRAFLREEFVRPVVYRPGGFTVSGVTVGEREVDCSRMERPGTTPGRNLLTGAGLDDPCGWIFVPHLGGKVRRDRTAAGGACFCLRDDGEQIVQVVDLGALAALVDRGALRATLSGRVRGASAELVAEPLEEADPLAPARGTRWAQVGGDAPGWRTAASTFELPPGTRALRVALRRAAGRGALFAYDTCFDELSLELARR